MAPWAVSRALPLWLYFLEAASSVLPHFRLSHCAISVLFFEKRLYLGIRTKTDREKVAHLSISLLKVSRKNQEAGVEGKEKKPKAPILSLQANKNI